MVQQGDAKLLAEDTRDLIRLDHQHAIHEELIDSMLVLEPLSYEAILWTSKSRRLMKQVLFTCS